LSQQINLYNAAFEHKRDLLSFAGAITTWGAALGLVVGLMLAMTLRSSNLEHDLARAAAERDAAQADLTRLAGQLAARKANPELTAKVQRLAAELAGRKEVMSTLRGGVIGNTHGFSKHLTAFARQSFVGLWLTSLRIANAGQDVVLEGRALRPELVPDYLRRLNREEVMRGHAFAELEMRQPESTRPAVQESANYIEFRISTLPLVAAAGGEGGG
jgi:hypothetical protein